MMRNLPTVVAFFSDCTDVDYAIDACHRFCAGVVHSFTDSAEDRDKLLSFSNLYIGINGCSLKTAENLDVVRGIPIERLMIETDSPYCEIKNTHAGIKFVKSVWASKKKEKHDEQCIVKGRNEPCLVRQVLEVLAGCKGIMDINQLSETLYHNTCRVFFPQDLDSAADALLAVLGNAAGEVGARSAAIFKRSGRPSTSCRHKVTPLPYHSIHGLQSRLCILSSFKRYKSKTSTFSGCPIIDDLSTQYPRCFLSLAPLLPFHLPLALQGNSPERFDRRFADK
uniref:Uncharacterized protein n=1 Tax=Cucumis melo TaxID=3656 RepID=A0A9I9EAE5_CUCME